MLGFQLGIFSFIGVELVGTVAAETADPHKNLPKAINSIVLRVLKRALIRDGLPLTAAIPLPGTGEDAQD